MSIFEFKFGALLFKISAFSTVYISLFFIKCFSPLYIICFSSETEQLAIEVGLLMDKIDLKIIGFHTILKTVTENN